MKHPEKINMVVFRENTEDLYAGIEWASGTDEAEALAEYLKTQMGSNIPPLAGIGIKPSARATPNGWWPVRSAMPWRTGSPV